MDPSILKSLQKIQELVKNKKEIIEQIPLKPTPEPTIIKPQGNAGIITPSIQYPNILNLNNGIIIPTFENNPFFAPKSGIQNQPPVLNYPDGIITPNKSEFNHMPIFPENVKNNEKQNGLNSMKLQFFKN